jgi:hypothetical protein
LLFTYDSAIDQRTVHAHTLVVTLGSYLDAGHSQRILNDHLLNSLPNHRLGYFDADQVFDYAGHRPHIIYDKDHFAEYEAPEIILHQLKDSNGQNFLLLSGPEPSLQWERMAAAIDHVIDEFDVQQTVLVHGFPAPSPHTRPVRVTKFASDPELIPINSGMPASFQMSSSFGSLLTLRLGEKGRAVIGLSAHVPQYLVGTDFQDSALALLNSLAEVTQLSLPHEELDMIARMNRTQIDSEVARSPELSQVLEQMETNYDHFISQRGLPVSQEDLPTADELGLEFENFLRSLDGDTDPGSKDEGPMGPQLGTGSPDAPQPGPEGPEVN